METAGNHFVELIAPLMLIIPLRKVQIVGGSIQILFQVSFNVLSDKILHG